MNKLKFFGVVSGLLLCSTNAVANDYEYDKFSMGTSNYKLSGGDKANGFDLQSRLLLPGDFLLKADFSRVEINSIDIDQYTYSAGIALANSDKSLTAIGLSTGTISASSNNEDIDFNSFDVIHSLKITDSTELNTRLSRVFVDDGVNYYEAEFGVGYKFAGDVGAFSRLTLTSESEMILTTGLEFNF